MAEERKADMLNITIDGKTIQVKPGTTVLQACEQAASPVPFYCYHPGLSIAGNCRICLVEIEKMPKLAIACHVQAADGMVVHTQNDNVHDGRRSVMEFLLVNHPLDCPVCDQAGECWLQDYYMAYGLYDPKFNEQKVKKHQKATPIGPHVMLDQDRCILCSRCTRFTAEITGTGELGIFQRGDHAEVGVFPGVELNNNYSGNVVDICPVGALTDRDFRFKCRVWYLGSGPSICTGCSRGCNIEVHYNQEHEHRSHIAGGDRVMRLKPRYNPDVNQWWMCDEGRYNYRSFDRDRLLQPQLRRQNELVEVTWDEALDEISGVIGSAVGQGFSGRVGVLTSAALSNEDLFAIRQVFRDGLQTQPIEALGSSAGASDDLLLKSDKNPNTSGLELMGFINGIAQASASSVVRSALDGQVSVLYVFGVDLAEVLGTEQATRVAAAVKCLVFQGSNANGTSALAHAVLPAAVHIERDGTFTNFEGRVQRFSAVLPVLGEAKPGWEILRLLAKRLKTPFAGDSAEAVFDAMTQSVRGFNGLQFSELGEHGRQIAATPAGAEQG